jgi:hypothetical protein
MFACLVEFFNFFQTGVVEVDSLEYLRINNIVWFGIRKQIYIYIPSG